MTKCMEKTEKDFISLLLTFLFTTTHIYVRVIPNLFSLFRAHLSIRLSRQHYLLMHKFANTSLVKSA